MSHAVTGDARRPRAETAPNRNGGPSAAATAAAAPFADAAAASSAAAAAVDSSPPSDGWALQGRAQRLGIGLADEGWAGAEAEAGTRHAPLEGEEGFSGLQWASVGLRHSGSHSRSLARRGEREWDD